MKTMQEIKNKTFNKILTLLTELAHPIELSEQHHIEERRLKMFVHTCYELYLGNSYSLEEKKLVNTKVQEFLNYLKTQGVIRKENIYYGIGKVPTEKMDEKFGTPNAPKNVNTFFAGTQNRNKLRVRNNL